MSDGEVRSDTPGSNESVPAGIKYAVDKITEIAEGPASYVLFVVGMGILCFVLFAKYGPQLLLGRTPIEVSTIDFLGSIVAAIILLIVGASLRYAIHAQEISKIGELEKARFELTLRFHERKAGTAAAAAAELAEHESSTIKMLEQEFADLKRQISTPKAGEKLKGGV